MRAFAFCLTAALLWSSVAAAQPAADPDTLYNTGNADLAKHDEDGAIAAFTAALQLSPRFVAALRSRAQALRDKGNYDAALADYNQALSLVPGNLAALSGRAELYIEKGDFDDALADYDQAVQRDPVFWPSLASRAVLYGKRKDLDHALADINEVLKQVQSGRPSIDPARQALDPAISGVITMRGTIYADQGDFAHAMADFNQVLDKNTADYSALYERCFTRAREGQEQDDGLEDCNRALQQTPDGPGLLDSRGLIYYRTQKFDLAKADYDMAVAANNFPPALYKRGILKIRTGDAAGGQADIAAAMARSAHAADDTALAGVTPDSALADYKASAPPKPGPPKKAAPQIKSPVSGGRRRR